MFNNGQRQNAIDYLYGGWNNKAAAIVSDEGSGGGSARLVLTHVMVATVRAQVGLSLFTDFESFTTFARG